MRILIAEDDLTSRAVLTGVLEKEGYDVRTTVNGLEAWEALQQPDAPRLAILDWVMPGLDGLEVVRRLRELRQTRPPYTIMLTAKGAKGDIVTGLDAGANDYLAKPFDPGELRARVAVGRRMVELQDALVTSHEVLAHQASHDALTGLLNRRAILERLREELARMSRHGGLLALGLCDIDHFKQVNDTHGHQTGDDVLEALARLMGESLRAYDVVGRLGGEEFLVVAPMQVELADEALFTRFCETVAASRIETRTGVIAVTVSIGVVWAGEHSTVDALLEAADAALYRAKREGRNRVVCHGPRLADWAQPRAS